MIAPRQIALLLVAVLWGLPGWAAPPTVSELVAAGRLTAEASLTPTENIVPGQKLRLLVTVATARMVRRRHSNRYSGSSGPDHSADGKIRP